MESIILILTILLITVVYDLIKTKKENKILYNNYHTALNILAETDSKLKEYLERGENNE